jgi:hypothetical protein
MSRAACGSCVGSGARAGRAISSSGVREKKLGEIDPLDADSDRVEEHRAADAVVLAHGHLGGDPAADR